MLTADVAGDHFIKVIAGNLQGGGHSHAVHAQHGDVGGAAADVHDHMAAGTPNVQTGTQTGSQRLLNQEHTPGTGFDGGVNDGTLLHLGHAGGHGDDHTGLGAELGGLVGGLEHLLQHPNGHLVVADDAVLQRVHGNDVAGGTAQHIPGGGAHLQHLAGVLVHGNHRRLPDHQTLAIGVDQNVGGTQVNTQVIGK